MKRRGSLPLREISQLIIYERTTEEVERAEQVKLRQKIHRWAMALVYNELAKPDSKIMKELNNYFCLGRLAQETGRLEEAKKYYGKILYTNEVMYNKAVEYITKRVELEERLKNYNKLASELYNEGRLTEAKVLWTRIITESGLEVEE